MHKSSRANIETDLVDLNTATLKSLRARDKIETAAALRRQLRDVERPRVNIGGTGPPGYAGYDKPSKPSAD